MVIKVNNKGQTLVAFILILPIILMVFAVIIDFGMYNIERRHIISNVKDSIKYGLKNIDSDNIKRDMESLLYKNIDNKSIKTLDISLDNDSITININVEYKTIFSKLLKFYNEINLSYFGKIENNEVKITKR